MDRRHLWAGLVVVGLAASLRAIGSSQESAARPGLGDVIWRTDLATANAEAAELGRPLLVVFR